MYSISSAIAQPKSCNFYFVLVVRLIIDLTPYRIKQYLNRTNTLFKESFYIIYWEFFLESIQNKKN